MTLSLFTHLCCYCTNRKSDMAEGPVALRHHLCLPILHLDHLVGQSNPGGGICGSHSSEFNVEGSSL